MKHLVFYAFLALSTTASYGQRTNPSASGDERRLGTSTLQFLSSDTKGRLADTGDKALVDVIKKEAAQTQARNALATNTEKRSIVEHNAAQRLFLINLSKGAVPKDAIQDVVPGMTAAKLRNEALAAKPDPRTVLLLNAAFGDMKPLAASKPLKRSHVESVNPNTPYDDALAPGTLPVDFKQPAKPFDPATNRNTKGVWRTGFSYVVALAPSAGDKRLIFCAGALIGKEWVLTATHCLFDREKSQQRSLASFSVYFPFIDNGLTLFTVDGRKSDKMLQVPVKQVRWLGDADSARSFPISREELVAEISQGNDVALIQLDNRFPYAPAYPREVVIARDTSVSGPVTITGYGLTNARQAGNFAMEIASRRTEMFVTPNFFITAGSDPTGSYDGRLCPYDSGAPVIDGDVDGALEQVHRLIGVVTGAPGVFTGTTEICFTGQQQITRLNRPRVWSWYCAATSAACG
jgi:hypothetical protein